MSVQEYTQVQTEVQRMKNEEHQTQKPSSKGGKGGKGGNNGRGNGKK